MRLNTLIFISLLISLALPLISSVINIKSLWTSSAASPFECGFDPFSIKRPPFSSRFFILVVLFLIFDIELSLLMGVIKNYSLFCSSYILTQIIGASFILIIGILHEWNEGALSWREYEKHYSLVVFY